MSLGVIIQARMGSKRLPGKVLKPFAGEPMLGYMLRRLTRLEHDAKIVIATSVENRDNVIESFCRERGVRCFRGDHENVLKRYYDCARHHGFARIIRLTADDPFFDVEEIDRLIDAQRETGADLIHSYPSLPYGVGAEIFTFKALAASVSETRDPFHLEHADEYILQNPGRFKIRILDVRPAKKKPKVRLTVDTPADYGRACFIAEHKSPELLSTEDVVRLAVAYEARDAER